MNPYKTRFEMFVAAGTVGRKRAEDLGLGKDWRNWTPLLVWCYETGVFGGLIGGILIGYILFR